MENQLSTLDLEIIGESNDIDNSEESRKKSVKPKTVLRIQYDAQVAVIQKQVGSLEKIQESLGLSGRKISQLLLVDPSSWTRWTRGKESAPPPIWRALQWYMILQEKIPGLTPQYFLGKDPAVLQNITLKKIQEITLDFDKKNLDLINQNIELTQKLYQFERSLKKHQIIHIVLMFIIISLFILFFFFK